MNLFSNKVFWGLVITFLVSGLGGITGLVSPQVSEVIALVIGGLTTLGHSLNVVSASKPQ